MVPDSTTFVNLGTTTTNPAILNNQGYSYLLRGDYRHAREKLAAARDLDPGNPFIQNNLDLLANSARR